MKFTTLIPTIRNDGTPFTKAFLERVIDEISEPFEGMSEEGEVVGRWTDEDGTVYRDVCKKISIACESSRLQDAIRVVKKAGRKLEQRAMYFEVSGYDGVQILRIS